VRRFVGLDFGGTAVKAGAVDAEGSVQDERSMPTELERGAADVLDRAARLARELGVEGALGVGIAGLVQRATGTLIESPNLSELNGVRLSAELGRRLGLRAEHVYLENDANVAALGEQWLGAGRGHDDVLVVTLGTGVGGGLILGGELFIGGSGFAGEIGHVVVDPSGIRCGCGSIGCLETLASATAAARRARERGLPADRPGDVEHLCDRARETGGPERELLLEIGRDLGRGLAYAVVLVDLSCFVFAGGFARALDLLEPGIRAGIEERTFGARKIVLQRAELGTSAGWLGAARLALERRAAR